MKGSARTGCEAKNTKEPIMAAKTFTKTQWQMRGGKDIQVTVTMHLVNGSHCQACGNAQPARPRTGYSACCDQLVVEGGTCQRYDDCYHG